MFDAAVFPPSSVALPMIKLTPTLSEMLHETLPFESPAAVPLQVAEATPDRESDSVPVIVIGLLDTVLPSTGELMTNVGGVLSILSVTLVVAGSPFASVAVPLTTPLLP